VYTALDSGRNLSVTAGLDLDVHPVFQLLPSVEIRGTYPVESGQVDGQRNVLAGIKLGKRVGRTIPYVDFLAGRGEISYKADHLSPNQQFLYVQSVSPVFASGAGLDLRFNKRFSIKGDIQIERYNTPITTSGHLIAKALTIGVIYHFSFDGRRRR